MGVYIKGMEMPKDGCHHMICIYADGTVSTGGRAYMAVPVAPHGRLVDADVLMRHCVMLPRDGGSLPVVYASYLRNAPTIIPAEEAPAEDINVSTTYDLLYEEGGYNSNGV